MRARQLRPLRDRLRVRRPRGRWAGRGLRPGHGPGGRKLRQHSRTAMPDDAFDPALTYASRHAQWAGIRYSAKPPPCAWCATTCPEKNESLLEEGAMCEVLVDGHFGHAATADLSSGGPRSAASTARCHHARHGQAQSAGFSVQRAAERQGRVPQRPGKRPRQDFARRDHRLPDRAASTRHERATR